ncbi:ImmA/IrrE family metallo-endopeptidase [Acetobacter sp. DsW_063]|uniref:ImmA/IrrE family metallo-endopeptidase n=1 Tax=Acetobacter sp. DsW_063 TaxID=1514894 RepID=UPI001302D8E9|nr:ImmA/IrrE family metallo-endopeptidase [Acetobacter sp. DsW_063]
MATNDDNILSFPNAARRDASGRRLIPERLKEARYAKSLNQAELGERIGKTRQAVSAFELGERTPEGTTLAQIADLLEQPVSYFTTPDRSGFGPFGPRFFRASGAETKRRNLMCDAYANWEVQIAHYLGDSVNYPSVNFPSVSPSDFKGAYEEEEIEDAAEKCRSVWGLGYGPISNILSLAESKGIIVSRLRMEGERIEAFSFWNGARPFIFLASEKFSASRARFDVAHEIGHLVLHRGVGQEDIEDPKTLKRIEAEANRFAGALLLPRRSFPNEVFTTRLDAFVELKKRWKVAIQAMVFRCKDLGIFDEYQVTNLYKQISARKWRTKEPLDDLEMMPLEQPKLLKNAVDLILSSGRKNASDLRNELALSPKIIEALCNLEDGAIAPAETDPPLHLILK